VAPSMTWNFHLPLGAATPGMSSYRSHTPDTVGHESSNQLQPGGAKCRPALSSKQDHYARGGEEHRAIQEGLTPVAAVSPELRQQKGEDSTPEATPERYECDCRDGKAG
jgi:hypothetical protein